jgi:HEAT repeat protein
MSEKKKNGLKQLIADLQSDDDNLILTALEKSPGLGTTEITPVLIELLLHENEEIQVASEKVLHSLKDSASANVLIQALDNSDLKPVYHKIIATFWMAGLDANPYLTRLVKAAIEGSFLDCMEVYSIIDNAEVEDLPHDQVMESLLMLNTYFERNSIEQKNELLKDIAKILQEA